MLVSKRTSNPKQMSKEREKISSLSGGRKMRKREDGKKEEGYAGVDKGLKLCTLCFGSAMMAMRAGRELYEHHAVREMSKREPATWGTISETKAKGETC